MKLQVKVEDGVVSDVKFLTFGCGSAIASSSYATEWLRGKSIDEALSLKNTDIASHLRLPPVKLHCSMLAEDAVKSAIKDYARKTGVRTPGLDAEFKREEEEARLAAEAKAEGEEAEGDEFEEIEVEVSEAEAAAAAAPIAMGSGKPAGAAAAIGQ